MTLCWEAWLWVQTELLDRKAVEDPRRAVDSIFDWIEVFYDRARRHSSLGMLSPAAYEKLHTSDPTAV